MSATSRSIRARRCAMPMRWRACFGSGCRLGGVGHGCLVDRQSETDCGCDATCVKSIARHVKYRPLAVTDIERFRTVLLIKRNALSICPFLQASEQTLHRYGAAGMLVAIVAKSRAAQISTLGPCSLISHLLPALIRAINHAPAGETGCEMHATTTVRAQGRVMSIRPLAIQAGASFTTGTVAAAEISSPHRVIRRDRLATIAAMQTSAHRPAVQIATHCNPSARSMRFKASRRAHHSRVVHGSASSITIRSVTRA